MVHDMESLKNWHVSEKGKTRKEQGSREEVAYQEKKEKKGRRAQRPGLLLKGS